jgi:translation initiation factor IF-3
MRISRYRRFQKPVEPQYRANEHIRAPEVRVIDENAKNLGVLATAEALVIARERGFDLVEVMPNAAPPIAKLLDWGQFKYEKEKEARKQKAHAHKVEVKGIRLSIRIGEHDRGVRLEKAKEFLDGGDRVQVEIILRGRERQFVDLARQGIDRFVADLDKAVGVKIDQPFARQGGRLTVVVAKK